MKEHTPEQELEHGRQMMVHQERRAAARSNPKHHKERRRKARRSEPWPDVKDRAPERLMMAFDGMSPDYSNRANRRSLKASNRAKARERRRQHLELARRRIAEKARKKAREDRHG